VAEANGQTVITIGTLHQAHLNWWKTGFLRASAVKGSYQAQGLPDRFHYLVNKNRRRNFILPKGGHGTESVANPGYISSCMIQSQEGFLPLFPTWPKEEAKLVRLSALGAFKW